MEKGHQAPPPPPQKKKKKKKKKNKTQTQRFLVTCIAGNWPVTHSSGKLVPASHARFRPPISRLSCGNYRPVTSRSPSWLPTTQATGSTGKHKGKLHEASKLWKTQWIPVETSLLAFCSFFFRLGHLLYRETDSLEKNTSGSKLAQNEVASGLQKALPHIIVYKLSSLAGPALPRIDWYPPTN